MKTTHINGRTLAVLSALFLLAGFWGVTTSHAQERKQAVHTQVTFVCSDGPVSSHDEAATVKVWIGSRPLQTGLITYDVPVGGQDLKVVTQPPSGSWTIKEIKFFDASDLAKPGSKTFTPNAPDANVSLSLSSRYGTNVSRLEITVDQCGGPVATSNAVRIIEPETTKPWCEGDSRMTIVTNQVPKGVPEEAAMILVGPGGRDIGSVPIGERYKVKQKTTVLVPEGDWKVRVIIPGLAEYQDHLDLEAGGSFTFPCLRDPSGVELVQQDIELSGGVYEWVKAGFPHPYSHPYLTRLRSKPDAVCIKDTHKGLRGSLPAPNRGPDASALSHHRSRVNSLAGSRVRVEIRPNQGTTFSVYEGEFEVEPDNSKSFILGAGQQVRITRGSVGPITGVKNATEGTASGVTIKTKKPVYAPNERIEVQYANPAGHGWDWIVLARPGEGAQSAMGGDLGNRWSSRIADERSGTKTFDGLAEGQYDARYISWDGGNNRITARLSFTVGNAPPPSSTGGPPSATGSSYDLSGLWLDDTGGGGIYRVRQVGNQVYWNVDGVSKGSFANFFHGEISGNTVNGEWVDLPGSPTLSGGKLVLRIESKDRLVKVSSSNSYGAKEWRRQRQ